MRKQHWINVLLLCFAVGAAHRASAQTPSISLSAGSGAPGSTVTVSASLSTNGGTQPAGLQFDLYYATSDINPVSGTYFATGAAAAAAGKSTSCNVVSPGDIRCLVVGFNSSVMGNGVVATVSFQISPSTTSTTASVNASNVSGTDASASSITMTGSGTVIGITGGGGTSGAVLSSVMCTPASVAPPATASCSVNLTAAAPSSTVVALSSSSPYATVPSSVTVNAGSSSVGFTVNAPTSVTLNLSALIVATLSGNSRTFSLGLTSPVSTPGVSSVACGSASLTGGSSTSCTVYLIAPAPPGGATVSLSSTSPYALVPPSVTVPAGLSSAAFTVSTSAVGSTQSVSISASSGGSTQSAALSVQPSGTSSAYTLTCSPGTIGAAGTAVCTLTSPSAAGSGGIAASLSSSSSSVSVPGSVVITAGNTSATFNATAGTPGGDVTAVLTATLGGSTVTYSLSVTSGVTLSAINCDASVVAAGGVTNCTVSLTKAAGAGGVEVALASSNAKLTSPGSVVIAAGNTSATFAATVAASALNETAALTATVGPVSHSTTLTIGHDPHAPGLNCSPSIVQTPGVSTCTFNLGITAGTNTLVLLSSSSPNVTIPPSLTIVAGTTSVTFTATAGAVTSNTTVTLSAPAQSVSLTMTLLPIAGKATVTSVACATPSLTGGGSSACSVSLSAAAPTGGLSVQLSSSSTQASVPAAVLVTEGNTTAPFSLTTSVIDHDETVTVIANLSSSSTQTKLSLIGLKLLSLACSPKPLRSGSPLTCQATLNSAMASSPVTLALSTSDSHVSLPLSVNSQLGQAGIGFQANTTYVPLTQGVTIGAAYHGTTVHDSVTLTPAPPVLSIPGRQFVRPGKLDAFTISATDPAGLAIALSASSVPPNAAFNPNGGAFTWVPDVSQVGLYTVRFTATNIALVSTTQDMIVEVASDTPVISSVANAASYVDDGGCSPGAVVTLLGTGFARTEPKAAEVSPIPTLVNGVRIKINGSYVPVFYASESQVNFQCPQFSPGDPVTLTMESDTGASPPHASKMQFATPGIFSIDGSGKGQGAVLIANTATLAMPPTPGIPSRPAKPGEFVSIYATGLGPTHFNVPSGSPAPLDTIDAVKGQVDALIDGQQGEVTFAGLAPGFTGLYQVNVQIPTSASTGDAVAVQLAIHLPDGSIVKSNVVTIGVAAAN